MEIQVDITWTDCFLLALLCMVIPMDWLMSGFMAAFFHELCHILAVRCMKGKISSVRIGCRGTVLDATPMEPIQEFLCILAGPAGSFSLLMLSLYFPKIALCGIVQGTFNLLPVYPLDGGRAIFCLTGMLFSAEAAAQVCTALRHVFGILLVFMGFIGVYRYDLGLFSVITIMVLLYKAAVGKFPCNAGKLAVQ